MRQVGFAIAVDSARVEEEMKNSMARAKTYGGVILAAAGLPTQAARGGWRHLSGKGKPRLRPRGDAAYAWLSSCEEGNALVEFAMVAPVMMMIMMGIIVIGSTMSNYLQLIEATASGARTIAVSRSNTLDPCNTVATAISSGAPLLNSANLTYTLVLNSSLGANVGTYGPTKGSLSCSSANYTSGAPSYLQQGGAPMSRSPIPAT